MICLACGCEQLGEARFCRGCGAPVALPAGYVNYVMAQEMEKRERVRQHTQPLGIMWIMFGVYRLVTGVIGSLMLHHLADRGLFHDAPPFVFGLLGTLLPFFAVISTVLGVASIVAGWGLLTRQTWARVLTMVLGILALLKIPFGTALGIYSLWVLAPKEGSGIGAQGSVG